MDSQDAFVGACTPSSPWLWINYECGGKVRNDVFRIPFHTNTFTFLLLCNRRLKLFTGSLLRRFMTVAVTQFDCNFSHK